MITDFLLVGHEMMNGFDMSGIWQGELDYGCFAVKTVYY